MEIAKIFNEKLEDKISISRLKHCYTVARVMYILSKKYYHWNEQKAREMFLLGMLHDQGYEFSDDTHEKIITNILGKDYKYINEILYHNNYTEEYASNELDLLWLADMIVDSKGDIVGFENRLKDILERHGEKEYNNSYQLIKYLEEKFH